MSGEDGQGESLSGIETKVSNLLIEELGAQKFTDIPEPEASPASDLQPEAEPARNLPGPSCSQNKDDTEWLKDILPIGRESFTGKCDMQNVQAVSNEDGIITIEKIMEYFINDNIQGLNDCCDVCDINNSSTSSGSIKTQFRKQIVKIEISKKLLFRSYIGLITENGISFNILDSENIKILLTQYVAD